MKSIARIFARTKHWQVFLFIAVLCSLSEWVAVHHASATVGTTVGTISSFVSMGLCAICFALWVGPMGSFLNSMVDSKLRLNFGLFRIAVIFPCLYLPFFDAAFVSLTPSLLFALLPFHAFAVFCLFYDVYFVAKSLALAEASQRVSFPDYRGYVLGLLFFPFGIWFIQPRINRIYDRASGLEAA
jgi:hypothetical protein